MKAVFLVFCVAALSIMTTGNQASARDLVRSIWTPTQPITAELTVLGGGFQFEASNNGLLSNFVPEAEVDYLRPSFRISHSTSEALFQFSGAASQFGLDRPITRDFAGAFWPTFQPVMPETLLILADAASQFGLDRPIVKIQDLLR